MVDGPRHEDSEILVDVDGLSYNPVLHPAIQVGAYTRYYRDFLRVLDGKPDAMTGVAYLHNANDAGVADLWALAPTTEGRMFTGQRRAGFLDFLQTRLSPESGTEAADTFIGSSVAPSKQLLKMAADEIRQREQFVLLDEQRVAYELVLRAVEQARAADVKEVIVVTGGPGTGKSVIALSVLGELARQGRTVLHATGSRSFTTTMRRVAGKGSPQTQQLFKYFNSFMEAERNGLDVLVLDEAHRLREKSVDRYTPASLRATARSQVDELLDAARVPVFLLDEYQVVRPGELGTAADIQAHAAARGLTARQVDLGAQYRSGGSAAYIDWVLRLLGLRGDRPVQWTDEDASRCRWSTRPRRWSGGSRHEARRGSYSARMTAGFCWPWSDPVDGTLVADVKIGDWKRPWNVKGDRAVGGDAPTAALWATEPGGFSQVGCIYTAQGFEYDWNGVIIGPDLVIRDGMLGFAARDHAVTRTSRTPPR